MKLLEKNKLEIVGNTPLMKMMRACKLTRPEGSKFLVLCEEIDRNSDGLIDIDEFFAYMEFDQRQAAQKLFMLMEVFAKLEPRNGHQQDATGLLNKPRASIPERIRDFEIRRRSKRNMPKFKYVEFFAAVYNFLTLDHKGMVRFMFDMIDGDQSGQLTKVEIVDMVRHILHTKEKEIESKVSQLMLVLDEDRDGGIEFEEFYAVNSRLATLMFPLLKFQKDVQAACIGEYFWKRCCKTRQKNEKETGQGPIESYWKLTNLWAELEKEKEREKKAAALERKRKEDEELARQVEETYSEPSITKEEADDVLDKVFDEHDQEVARIKSAGERLKKTMAGNTSKSTNVSVAARKARLAGDDAYSDVSADFFDASSHTAGTTTKKQKKTREGEWWIEATPEESQPLQVISKPYSSSDAAGKSLVSVDTADVLSKADRVRLRAAKLASPACVAKRQVLLDKFEQSQQRLLKVDKSVAAARASSVQCSCCCCFGSTRRPKPAPKSANPSPSPSALPDVQEQQRAEPDPPSEHEDKVLPDGQYAPPVAAPPVAPVAAAPTPSTRPRPTATGPAPASNLPRTSYTREITGLPPPSLLAKC